MYKRQLFEIVYLLLERGQLTARELAARFEVSERTIYRDIEALSMSGVPVYCAKGQMCIRDSSQIGRHSVQQQPRTLLLPRADHHQAG